MVHRSADTLAPEVESTDPGGCRDPDCGEDRYVAEQCWWCDAGHFGPR